MVRTATMSSPSSSFVTFTASSGFKFLFAMPCRTMLISLEASLDLHLFNLKKLFTAISGAFPQFCCRFTSPLVIRGRYHFPVTVLEGALS
mmetsp:Transcript_57282/g.65308  ORF Transcript_57282/g.65308 Transcript_57282/m.65308 type:complete len:90 (-) Transcript_57282:125-394(-)